MVLHGVVLLASARGLYLARHLPTLFYKYVFAPFQNNISLQKYPQEPIPTSICEQIPWQIEIVMEQRWDGDLSWGFLPYVPIAQSRR